MSQFSKEGRMPLSQMNTTWSSEQFGSSAKQTAGNTSEIEKASEKPQSRALGKKSNPDYAATTVLMPKKLRRAAHRKLEDLYGREVDLSDKIEELLTEWISEGQTASDSLVDLNFKVPEEFRRRFKLAAVNAGISNVKLLEQVFDAWKKEQRHSRAARMRRRRCAP